MIPLRTQLSTEEHRLREKLHDLCRDLIRCFDERREISLAYGAHREGRTLTYDHLVIDDGDCSRRLIRLPVYCRCFAREKAVVENQALRQASCFAALPAAILFCTVSTSVSVRRERFQFRAQ